MFRPSVVSGRSNRMKSVVALCVTLAATTPLFAASGALGGLPAFVQPLPVATIKERIVEGARQTAEQFEKGGDVMWWLLGLSIVALAMAIERGLRLRRSRIIPVGLVANARSLWKQEKYADIITACEKDNTVMGRAIKTLVVHRDLDIKDLQEIVGTQIAIDMRFHFRRVTILSATAYLGPLIGLYGTVLGMMKAFQNFRLLGETGDPGVFAGEISLALVCTGGGLLVAIPSLALFHFYRQRTLAFEDELAENLHLLGIEWFKAKLKK